jgi:hypothetical protein
MCTRTCLIRVTLPVLLIVVACAHPQGGNCQTSQEEHCLDAVSADEGVLLRVGTAVYKKVDAHDVKTTLTKSRQPELSTDEFTEQVAAIADELTALVEGRQSDSSSDTGATDAGLTGAEVLEFVDTVIENAENLVDLSVGASDGSTDEATESLQEEIMEEAMDDSENGDVSQGAAGQTAAVVEQIIETATEMAEAIVDTGPNEDIQEALIGNAISEGTLTEVVNDVPELSGAVVDSEELLPMTADLVEELNSLVNDDTVDSVVSNAAQSFIDDIITEVEDIAPEEELAVVEDLITEQASGITTAEIAAVGSEILAGLNAVLEEEAGPGAEIALEDGSVALPAGAVVDEGIIAGVTQIAADLTSLVSDSIVPGPNAGAELAEVESLIESAAEDDSIAVAIEVAEAVPSEAEAAVSAEDLVPEAAQLVADLSELIEDSVPPGPNSDQQVEILQEEIAEEGPASEAIVGEATAALVDDVTDAVVTMVEEAVPLGPDHAEGVAAAEDAIAEQAGLSESDASLTGTERLSEDEFADQVAAIAEQLTAVVQEFQ